MTLLPGLYYMQGGGFSVSGTAKVTGTEVTIYNAPGRSGAGFTFSGATQVMLTGPATGQFQGLVLFQDPNSSAPFTVSGSNRITLNGTVYAPRGRDVLRQRQHVHQ